MAWRNNVLRSPAAVDRDCDGPRAIRRRNAGGDAVARLDRLGEGSPEATFLITAHQRKSERFRALPAEREADEAAAMARHEIDRIGGDHLRR